jgi:vancomycin permeability regulator SanA
MERLKRIKAWIGRHPRRAAVYGVLLACILFTFGANLLVWQQGDGRIYDDVAAVPQRRVGLVLGAGPGTLYFHHRIIAAAELYHAGKVEHLIVSGDNHVVWYDEPTAMKESLKARGVPESAITCDYAGFRTLDSVMRSNSVFGVSEITVISQEFHNRRAIAVARRHGIDAIGYNAAEVAVEHGRTTEIREVAARNMAVLDLYVLNRQPKFPGPYEPLELVGH